MSQSVEKVEPDFPNVRFFLMDVSDQTEEYLEIARQFNMRCTSQTLFFSHGKEVGRQIGPCEESELSKLIENSFGNH
jgi:hypothetical protein